MRTSVHGIESKLIMLELYPEIDNASIDGKANRLSARLQYPFSNLARSINSEESSTEALFSSSVSTMIAGISLYALGPRKELLKASFYSVFLSLKHNYHTYHRDRHKRPHDTATARCASGPACAHAHRTEHRTWPLTPPYSSAPVPVRRPDAVSSPAHSN